MADRNKENDLTIKKEQGLGPQRTAPTTRQVPPTDEELELLDRIRNADATGMDDLLVRLRSGSDLTKPSIVNALIDVMRHAQRAEKELASERKAWKDHATKINEATRDHETKTGRELGEMRNRFHELDKRVDAVVRYLSLPAWKRRRSNLPKTVTVQTATAAKR